MSDQSFTYDRWAAPDDPEFIIVRVTDLRRIERANLAIWAITKTLGNELSESEPQTERPLNAWILVHLIGGMESICDHVAGVIETSIDSATLPTQSR